ncbi:hypothetical protein EJD97_013188 [Solanum chilense]|uniref:Tf2-1-like SH3-like domain-containing protein n=1 Tax=Solanum chilense TaxID=4083 RepID=A0A6N2BCC5_SOLCI|nr:hypothetical protein EJD97_013188 [Solanum chilense]
MKRVVIFCKKGKLSPPYVGPYEILQRVGKVSYKLKLLSELTSVHIVYHVSMLMKRIADLDCIITIKGLGIKNNLSYEQVPVQIIYRQVKELWNKEVASTKVLWKNHQVEGATWEAEANMKSRYPHLFDN